uniref:Uncharacterized protein n=1 Tax=Arundo donax TaxID=35708 RepID=A0A0A9E9D2_ARUDO
MWLLGVVLSLMEMVFFVIDNVPNVNASKESDSTALITVSNGKVTARQIETEFQGVFGSDWRCYAKKWSENEFSMRFPNQKKIEELAHFTSMGMRTTNANITVKPWNPAVGAKGVMQKAWLRVKNIPHDSRYKPVLAYVGSLVGRTLEIDEASMFKQDYVRIKIGCRDVAKVLATTEGALDDYFYDFIFEREIPEDVNPPTEAIAISNAQNQPTPGLGERTPKKAKIDSQKASGSSTYVISGDKTYLKQASSLILVTPMNKSAPPKVYLSKGPKAPPTSIGQVNNNIAIMASGKMGKKMSLLKSLLLSLSMTRIKLMH